jgi:uncharacterized protein
MKRYCTSFIKADLIQKMVFIGGPRQVGKTTLSKDLLQDHLSNSLYLNWDDDRDREMILKRQWLPDQHLIILDELHKYPRWKSWIKGIYDTKLPTQHFLITGSARLDVYRRGGDSLLGRYHYWRLHPLSLDELPPELSSRDGLDRLLRYGGFPEPFLRNDEREARRWRRERFDRILTEDLRDLEQVRQIQTLTLFVDLLRKRVGGLVVLSNLATDLQISPNTAKHWLSILESLYLAFPVYSYTKNISRAIQKPPKVYFYDNADVMDTEGARFENLVATGLLKRLHFLEDYYGHRCSLHYIRDKDGREVDFLTVVDDQVIDLIEVKTSDTSISSSLKYYAALLKPVRAIQIVLELTRPFHQDGISVMSPIDFFSDPPWDEIMLNRV